MSVPGDAIKWAVAPTGSEKRLRFTIDLTNLTQEEAHVILVVIQRLGLYRATNLDAAAMEGLKENLAAHPDVLRVIGELLNREAGRPVLDPAKASTT